ncbi:tetratricopeptide repeat protein [Candidatus Omnitrophota bacterium]
MKRNLFAFLIVCALSFFCFLTIFVQAQEELTVEKCSELTEELTWKLSWQPQKALDYCLEVYESNPTDPTLHVMIGGLYSSLMSREKGIKYLNTALELDSNIDKKHKGIYMSLAVNYKYLGEDLEDVDVEKSNAMFDKAIEYNNMSLEKSPSLNERVILRELAPLYAKRGRYQESNDAYYKVLEIDKKNIKSIRPDTYYYFKNPYFKIAQNYLHMGKKQEALKIVDKLREIDEKLDFSKMYSSPSAPRLLSIIENYEGTAEEQ